MKVLVVGNGGREYALAWKFVQSPKVNRVICIPGNGGTATLEKCQNLPMRVDDFDGIARFAGVQGISLVVVGPEDPLAEGIVDYLQAQNIPVFGPTQAGAQIESSKGWAKTLMEEADVPTAKGKVFTDSDQAKSYIKQQLAPIVVKADGLAAGKGVIVAKTVAEAQAGVDQLWEQGFSKLVVEECLQGEELSVFALCDGESFRLLLPAQDHKRVGEGDTGANTGGMGTYAPAPLGTPELLQRVEREVIAPTLAALQKRGIRYCGVLYAGLMVAADGTPKVLEFNCRFGDPETQVILPLLETPLEQLLLACVQGKLESFPALAWQEGCAVCVVAASEGYPGKYEKGKEITGVADVEEMGAMVFQAGTRKKGGQLVTDGGRVLGVTATGPNFESAIANTYKALNKINFEGMYFRQDIAHRVRQNT
ncbi:phosphoribosylamine--glycine ligase [Spirulina sp. CS-785/01]|uniref:phosphoribosylamine--glycine ligase n=1 Tax=Spirulina sp. CS-785/01 TaxID=3021716 RepID=UPI003FA78183